MDIVDDSDYNRMSYSVGQWSAGGLPQEESGTTHWTVSAGATATFSFSGTYLEVYGTIDIPGSNAYNNIDPVSTYSIDGAPPTMFTGNRFSVKQYKVLFFRSSILRGEAHALVITSTAGFFILDYLQYTPIPNTTTAAISTAPASTSPPASTETAAISTAPASTSPPASTSREAASSTPVSHPSTNVPVGVLVGSIVGTAVLVVLCLIVWRRFLRKKIINPPGEATNPSPGVTPSPFILPVSSTPFPAVAHQPRLTHATEAANGGHVDSPPSYEVISSD